MSSRIPLFFSTHRRTLSFFTVAAGVHCEGREGTLTRCSWKKRGRESAQTVAGDSKVSTAREVTGGSRSRGGGRSSFCQGLPCSRQAKGFSPIE